MLTWIYCDDNISPPDWQYPGNGVTMADGWVVAGYNALNQPKNIGGLGYWGTANWMWFGYDPLGRCVKRWVSPSEGSAPNGATYYYYDGWNLIQEGPQSWNAQRLYVHGAGVDELVAQITPANNDIRYFHYDAMGNCILQTYGSGGIAEQYDYDAYGWPYFYDANGMSIGSYNPFGQWQGYSPSGNRFLFQGREWLTELKLYDYRNRLYQPELGRFMQPDPKEFAAGDYNLYRYCHNDPVNKADPTGENPIAIAIIVAYLLLSNTDVANAPGPGDTTIASNGMAGMIVDSGFLAAGTGGAAVLSKGLTAVTSIASKETPLIANQLTKIEKLAQDIHEAGGRLQNNPLKPNQEVNSTIHFGPRERINLRVESHQRPAGLSERHGNVEHVVEQGSKKIIKNHHIEE